MTDVSQLLLISFIAALIAAAAAGFLARRKGRSVQGWVLLGLLFGWPALLVLAMLPSMARPAVPAGAKICPKCGVRLNAWARFCNDCGTLLPDR